MAPSAVDGEPSAIGAGFDSYIHRVDLTGAALPAAWRVPLIVRLLPSPDRAPQAAVKRPCRGGARIAATPRRACWRCSNRTRRWGSPRRSWSGLRAPRCSMRWAPSPGGRSDSSTSSPALALSLHALPTDGWPEGTVPGHRWWISGWGCRAASPPSSTGPRSRTRSGAPKRCRHDAMSGPHGGVPR